MKVSNLALILSIMWGMAGVISTKHPLYDIATANAMIIAYMICRSIENKD